MEIWDIYDNERHLKGKTHIRGLPMKTGEYHLAVRIILFNANGEILLTRRSPEKKSYPGRWENTTGSVQAGEDSRTGALRELREETGIVLMPEELKFLTSRQVRHCFVDIYIAQKDVRLEELVFQPGETCGARWVSFQEWKVLVCEKDSIFTVEDHFEAFAKVVKRYMMSAGIMPSG